MTNGGKSFKIATLYKLYVKKKGNHSLWYHALIDGFLAEASNKTLYAILEKMMDKDKRTYLISYMGPCGLVEARSGPRGKRLYTHWFQRRNYPPTESTAPH